MTKGMFCLALALMGANAYAAFDLANLYTQTVKQNQTWANIDTRVDSLDLDIQADHGVITTTATVTYTPGPGYIGTYVCRQVQCVQAPCPDVCGYETSSEGIAYDSLETSMWGDLGLNAAVTDLYLWVGDAKVRAELQERSLASAQYEDIVKRRRDPALIETWGSGYYTLRIFPNKSGESRRIQLRIVQGMEDDQGVSKALLPFLHSRQPSIQPGKLVTDASSQKTIGKVTLRAGSSDGKTYSLNWPGLGEGKFGPTSLSLTGAKVAQLAEGAVSREAQACAGCLTPWTSLRGGKQYFGARALLTVKDLDFEAQPKERCVILDVDASDSLAPGRARKLALLSLKAYGQAPYAINLAFSDGKGHLNYLFPEAAVMDAGHLAQALAALKEWKPLAKADAHLAMEAFAAGRKAGAPTLAAVLINNDPYLYYQYPAVYDPATWEAEYAKARAFEQKYADLAARLAEKLNAAHVALFGFWNDYHLTLAAEATGGYQLGGVYGWIYMPYGYATDTRAGAAPQNEWYLPPLYGPGRGDSYLIRDLKAEASGLAVGDLVVLQDQDYRVRAMLEKTGARALGKSANSILAGPYGSVDSAGLRFSGTFQGSGKVTLKVSGLWGGLRFEKSFTLGLDASGAREDGAGLWATLKAEELGRDWVKYDAAAVQKLGFDFHVINRQVSLLALEPGMKLWEDLPAKEGANARDAATSTEGKSSMSGGMNLDQADLDALLNAQISGLKPGPASPGLREGLTVRAQGGLSSLEWTLAGGAATARFRIFDLSGREVAVFAAARQGDRFTAAWKAPRKGTYILRAESGAKTAVRKLALGM
jgi:hypothetical protein